MAHIDTRETVQSGRKFIKKAMKLPMLELEHEQSWLVFGKTSAMSAPCTN